MELNARETNVLKAIIEGTSLGNLYNRLPWDYPKTIRLNIEEKDVLESIYFSEPSYLTVEDKTLLKKMLKERL